MKYKFKKSNLVCIHSPLGESIYNCFNEYIHNISKPTLFEPILTLDDFIVYKVEIIETKVLTALFK